MKENKSGWQFPKALEIIKCKEGNKEFMKERPARRPFGNTVLICEYPIDDTAAEEPNAKLITWRLAKRAARDFLRVSFMPSAMLEKLKKAGHDDAFITYSGTSGGTSARKITTGSKVRVKAGAKTYSGGSLASFVYSRDHIVKELSGKRAVITYGGTVVAAVNVDDLTLV